jgi:hypothetical protein
MTTTTAMRQTLDSLELGLRVLLLELLEMLEHLGDEGVYLNKHQTPLFQKGIDM